MCQEDTLVQMIIDNINREVILGLTASYDEIKGLRKAIVIVNKSYSQYVEQMICELAEKSRKEYSDV